MDKVPSPDDSVYFARTNFRGEDRIFGIKRRDRRQHTYVIGKTGTGKSVMLKNMAIQDIQNGEGIAVVDPHGELVEQILASIPPHRVNDVIYFNPADSDYPLGFNVLEVPDPKYKHVVSSDLMGIFTKIWANVWSARMEYIMQNCIMALLDTPGTTLLGIPRLLVDREYRAKIIANIKDPVVRSFWTQEYENYTDRLRSEAIVPIQNKVGQFLNTSMVRNIVGQPKSTFSVQDAMNDRKILLVNVSKGRIGEDNSALLGAMLITKLQLGAMERVRIPEEQRTDFYLYVDEFQNFATDSFASVLSEARKYRLNLTIAHQYIGQLVTDVSTKVRDAVFGNAGTILSFRVGAADAEYLETEFAPEFEPQDVVNLPNYHIYLKLMVDGVTSRPFSATTLPPIPISELPDTVEKVIRVSRERYALPREEVENRIMRWSGMLPGDSADGSFTEEEQAGAGMTGAGEVRAASVPLMHYGQKSNSGPASATREEFDAICAACGKRIKVPFKPDPRRPVYCQNCLKKVKEGEILPVTMPRSVNDGTSGMLARSVQESPPSDGNALQMLGIEFAAAAGQAMQHTIAQSVPAITYGAAASPRYATVAAVTALFDAVCARCGKITKVNFQPDGKRPIYCKLCLPIIRSEEMRSGARKEIPLGGVNFIQQRAVIAPQAEKRPAMPNGAALRVGATVYPAADRADTRNGSPARPGHQAANINRSAGPMHGAFAADRTAEDRTEVPKPNPQRMSSAAIKTLPTAKPISLKEALGQSGSTFTGKKLKRKEVDLSALREALTASMETQELPDMPEPEAAPVAYTEDAPKQKKDLPHAKGKSLEQGKKILL